MQHKNDAGAGQDISVIALGARVVGDVETSGVVQVAGSEVGNVRAGLPVLVAKGGMVEGEIETPEAIIGGEVRGQVRATQGGTGYLLGPIGVARRDPEIRSP